MKESVKKKLVRICRNGLVGWIEWEIENWKKSRPMPQRWREKGREEDRNCDGMTEGYIFVLLCVHLYEIIITDWAKVLHN